MWHFRPSCKRGSYAETGAVYVLHGFRGRITSKNYANVVHVEKNAVKKYHLFFKNNSSHTLTQFMFFSAPCHLSQKSKTVQDGVETCIIYNVSVKSDKIHQVSSVFSSSSHRVAQLVFRCFNILNVSISIFSFYLGLSMAMGQWG